ncbi:ATP-dependent protease ATPase subunit HslU [Hymenobacter sp. UV11]|uniref:ATP-dependent protease ATPase subunit HslU n=1 Tax=Hymenobacter sp. UV11 TaxID=1849735 RepID=UPI00105E8EBF|nr:ATP-dependent protease ATPase subunit HslU [Hymenobacter sp. UV11]TDN38353.1 HslU--HslV peptidase ATPase subunit [Hymenobacter sp. UV11]TFZ68050.1 ATP-dependent protease ATPase subunit HslU [Hymenobacter sp. UV11]
MLDDTFLTPAQIVAELDKYIIGQHEAKRHVAIALRNRWRRLHAPADMQKEIVPNNILMIGATGVGKTEIARRLAILADAPFVKVEASKFTEVGYVGRDVESMVRDLAEQAVSRLRQRRQEEVKAQAAQAVEDIILDALIPPMKAPAKDGGSSPSLGFGIGISGERIAGDAVPGSDQELNERTRERFRQKIRNGELEDRRIEINVSQGAPSVGIMGAPGMMDEATMSGLQDMLGSMMPKKSRKRKVTVAEARKVLLDEEAAKLVDMDEIKEEAIRQTENAGIIFIDEIDKVATASSGKSGGGPDVSRQGVQRDLLPIVEGSAVNTKYGIVNTDHILFIAAGAFHVSKPSDLIPELQGRFPIRVELQSLTKDDFYRILKDPKNALTKQYQALLASEDVQLTFEDEALLKLADIAAEVNSEVENIGARRLHTVMSRLLNDLLFDVPDKIAAGAQLTITPQLVEERLRDMVKNRDMSQYIL